MKKTLAILLAALMLCSALAFTGCQGTAGIVGKWSTDLDMSSDLEDMLSEDIQIDTSFAKVTMQYEFKEDGTYTATVTEDSLNKFIDNLIDAIIDAAKTEFAAEGKSFEEGVGMSEEEVRTTYKSLYEQYMTFPEEDNCSYKLDGDKLYMGEDAETLEKNVTDGNYAEVKLEGGTLTFVSFKGEDPDGEVTEGMTELLPVTFKRG